MDAGTREEVIKGVRESFVDELRKVGEAAVRITADSRETIRNLALVSGGLAAGALVLLGTNIEVYPSLVLVGVIALMAEVALSFGYLLHVQNKDSRDLSAHVERSVVPISNLLRKYDELREGAASEQEFDDMAKEVATTINEKVKENNDNLSRSYVPNKWDLVFIGVLLFGMLMLGLGLLLPHTCSVWGVLCEK